MYEHYLQGKRVGLISNHTAVNGNFQSTLDLLYAHAGKCYKLQAVFAPEHGYYGNGYAYEHIDHAKYKEIPLFSLHGETRRPTEKMLEDVDLLIYDIQDIGSRSYTFISTLFYCMEEAAKYKIPLLVFDRPNPMGGCVVDGPLLEEKWRSFVGYVNIPYCHGMTIGELAKLFNEEYKVGCDLHVIEMQDYHRGELFEQTGLPWVPTSPQIPESETPFFYPTTGLLGHLSVVNIGVGYAEPFKLIGAPWIDAAKLHEQLEAQNLPGVAFLPCFYRPFFGKFKAKACQGVRIMIQDPATFLPITTQYTLMGVLKQLYPEQFALALQKMSESKMKQRLFHKLNGTEKVLELISKEKYCIWKLRQMCVEGRDQFQETRKKYLISSYST